MTNYTTEQKQTLTRKLWGVVVYLLYCAIFSYIATLENKMELVVDFP